MSFVRMERSVFAFAALVSGFALLSTACDTPMDMTPPPGDTDVVGIYVANGNNNTITVYDIDAEGDVAPKRTISGGSTGLNIPIGIGIDTQNNLYVANRKAGTVTVYPAGTANGDVAPTRVLTDPDMGSPSSIGIGPGDEIYVSTCPGCGSANGGQVGIFHFDTNATASDFRIGGDSNSNTGFTFPGTLALDWDRTNPNAVTNVIVGNAFGGQISTFAGHTQGDQLPLRSFSPGTSNLQTVAFGGNTIFAALPGPSILQFQSTATGNFPASGTINNYANPLGTFPGGVVVDTGVLPPVIYVADYSLSSIHIIQTIGAPPFLTVGSVRTIMGTQTGLNGPLGIAVVKADLKRVQP